MAHFLGIFETKFLSACCSLNYGQIRNIFFFNRNKRKASKYLVVRPRNDEYCDIVDLMWDAYHPDEPTTKSLNLGCKPNPVFDASALRMLSQGLSYVAKCKYTGCIVGASINVSTCAWDADQTDKLACTLCCKDTQQLYHFWAYLQRTPDIFNKYCVTNVFEIANVFVSKTDRGKGVAFQLMQESKILGGDAGFRVIRVDATNHLTSILCEKMNMTLIDVIPYCRYLGENHQPVFNPDPPNTEVKIYVDTPHAMKRRRGFFSR